MVWRWHCRMFAMVYFISIPYAMYVKHACDINIICTTMWSYIICNYLTFTFTFTFMHLADAFIQSDLQLHSGYTISLVCVFPGNRTHNLLLCRRNALPLSHTGTHLTLKHCQFWIGYLLQWLIFFWHFVCLATILLTQTDAVCSFLLLKQPQWKTYHAYIPGWRYKRFIRLKLWNAGSLREHNESFCV